MTRLGGLEQRCIELLLRRTPLPLGVGCALYCSNELGVRVGQLTSHFVHVSVTRVQRRCVLGQPRLCLCQPLSQHLPSRRRRLERA